MNQETIGSEQQAELRLSNGWNVAWSDQSYLLVWSEKDGRVGYDLYHSTLIDIQKLVEDFWKRKERILLLLGIVKNEFDGIHVYDMLEVLPEFLKALKVFIDLRKRDSYSILQLINGIGSARATSILNQLGLSILSKGEDLLFDLKRGRISHVRIRGVRKSDDWLTRELWKVFRRNKTVLERIDALLGRNIKRKPHCMSILHYITT